MGDESFLPSNLSILGLIDKLNMAYEIKKRYLINSEENPSNTNKGNQFATFSNKRNSKNQIMNALKEYIQNIVSLTNVEWQEMEACTETLTLDKTDILINANSSFKKEIFVQKGIVRAFIVDNDGNEKTTAFFSKGEFLSLYSFRTKNGLSLYTYQALNPSSLILLDTEKFSTLLKKTDKLKALVKAVKGKETVRLSNRDTCLLQVRGEDKYNKFRQYHPNIESEIAHHYIASYLGITPVSLSRIRTKLGINEYH